MHAPSHAAGGPPQPLERIPGPQPVAFGQYAYRLLDDDPGGERVLQLHHRQPQLLDLGELVIGTPGPAGRGKVLGEQVGEHHRGEQVADRPDLARRAFHDPSDRGPAQAQFGTADGRRPGGRGRGRGAPDGRPARGRSRTRGPGRGTA